MNAKARKYRVLLVDDHPVFREGLKALVDHHPRLTVVAEAAALEEAIAALEDYQPDLLITDLCLAQESGHDLVERCRGQRPEMPIVVLSIQNHTRDIARALSAGANAYLTKGASRQEVLHALDEVLSGRRYFPSTLAPNGESRQVPSAGQAVELTRREADVLEKLRLGKEPRVVAEELFLSVATVKTYMRGLFRKLNVSNRTQLVLKALEMGDFPANLE